MSNNPLSLTLNEEKALWEQARRCLMLRQTKPTVSADLADRLQAQLPARQQDEGIGDWVRRASTSTTNANTNVLPFRPKASRRLTPLTEFVRLAADSSGSTLSLPSGALESSDDRFRLRVLADSESSDVTIFIEALGLAADQFAHSCIGLLDSDNTNEPILTVDLDQDGDGQCQIGDTPILRRALLNPVIVLVE